MESADVKGRLSTVAAVVVTPFEREGGVDGTALRALVARMIDHGVSVITANGNTGEFYALSLVEQRAVVRETAAAAADRALLVAGVGYDLATAIESGRFAIDHGARVIMVHQPVHPFQSAEGWVAYHREIARALPEAGIVPYVRDPSITLAMLCRLAEMENVVGVKYAVPDPQRFAATVAAIGADRLAWICGLAEGWAPFFWPAGAVGFTSGLVNARPSLSLAMLDHLRAADYSGAMAVWRAVHPFEALRARDRGVNNVSVVKEALAQLGLCHRAVRPPISALTTEERAAVERCLLAWGDE